VNVPCLQIRFCRRAVKQIHPADRNPLAGARRQSDRTVPEPRKDRPRITRKYPTPELRQDYGRATAENKTSRLSLREEVCEIQAYGKGDN